MYCMRAWLMFVQDCAKPVLSESVRADIAAEPGATDVTSTDGSTVQDAPLAGMVTSLVSGHRQ